MLRLNTGRLPYYTCTYIVNCALHEHKERYMYVYVKLVSWNYNFSSDEEGSLSITAEKRTHPESQAVSTGSTNQQRRPQRRPQLWKRKPMKKEEEEGEEGREEVGLEEEREESRDNEYEDEDFGKWICIGVVLHNTQYGVTTRIHLTTITTYSLITSQRRYEIIALPHDICT